MVPSLVWIALITFEPLRPSRSLAKDPSVISIHAESTLAKGVFCEQAITTLYLRSWLDLQLLYWDRLSMHCHKNAIRLQHVIMIHAIVYWDLLQWRQDRRRFHCRSGEDLQVDGAELP